MPLRIIITIEVPRVRSPDGEAADEVIEEAHDITKTICAEHPGWTAWVDDAYCPVWKRRRAPRKGRSVSGRRPASATRHPKP